VAATKGSGKRATECSASFIYAVDAPRKERREIEKDSVFSTMESFGCLCITRKKTTTVADMPSPSYREGKHGPRLAARWRGRKGR
jgi:hypothetical protein